MAARFPLSTVLPVLALATIVAACSAGGAAPSTGASAAAEQSAAATTRPADFIDHPTGAADVVLRVGEEGGFVMMEYAMGRVPRFTMYGDGRVIIATPVPCKAAPGANCPPELREVHLSEDQVQAVLRSALVDGQLGVAKEEFPVHVMDVPTTVIELHAGGVDKEVRVAGLGMDPPPGPDAAVLTSLATLVDRLMAIPTTDDYQAPASVAVLAETEPAPGVTPAPWPWPDLAPSDFAKPPPDDPFGFTTHVLTAAQSDAIGSTPGESAGPLTFAGPDGKTYVVVVRPALPEEIPASA